jgi:hypothetical protein
MGHFNYHGRLMNPNAGRTCRYRRGNLPLCAATAVATGALAAVLLGPCTPACAQEPRADPAATLQAKRNELQPQLRSNAFGEPLYLSSHEGDHQIEGDVYAELPQSFAGVSTTFKSAAAVCQLLFLHLNVRSCQPSTTADGEVLTLSVGPKRALGPGMLHPMSYALRVEAATAAYLRVTLTAPEGPLSTRDYRIVFEAVPIDGSRSFVHLGYTYGYGMMAKIAMHVYLATAGRSKIGFTVIGQDADGRPLYVRGERGSLERNVIRYYLALLAYSSVSTGSTQAQIDARLRAWFALTERYAAQLHELDLDEYLHEKHDDLARAAKAK